MNRKKDTAQFQFKFFTSASYDELYQLHFILNTKPIILFLVIKSFTSSTDVMIVNKEEEYFWHFCNFFLIIL